MVNNEKNVGGEEDGAGEEGGRGERGRESEGGGGGGNRSIETSSLVSLCQNNVAWCHLRMEAHDKAVHFAGEGLKILPASVRSFYFIFKGNLHLEKTSEGKNGLERGMGRWCCAREVRAAAVVVAAAEGGGGLW